MKMDDVYEGTLEVVRNINDNRTEELGINIRIADFNDNVVEYEWFIAVGHPTVWVKFTQDRSTKELTAASVNYRWWLDGDTIDVKEEDFPAFKEVFKRLDRVGSLSNALAEKFFEKQL